MSEATQLLIYFEDDVDMNNPVGMACDIHQVWEHSPRRQCTIRPLDFDEYPGSEILDKAIAKGVKILPTLSLDKNLNTCLTTDVNKRI